MSATATATADADAKPAAANKKRLLIVAALAALLLAGGGTAWYVLQVKAAAAAAAEQADDDEEVADAKHDKARRKGPPVFSPLDPFTVNLADAGADRYAQIGITLELEQDGDAERIKQYMPAIRNNILMVLSHKSSADLLGRDGKTKLADEIRSETLRALDGGGDDGEPPVRAVHFSNFIVQ